VPPGAEGGSERFTDLPHDCGMGAALRLPNREQPVEELETLADEDAELDQPVVLSPAPTTRRNVRIDLRGHE
jgi:hypothetical protein